MGKRVTVKYLGGSHYTSMQAIPTGTEFKAVYADCPTVGGGDWVYIRGSSLTKAAGGKHEFSCKQYLFVLNHPVINNQMEIVS